MKTRPLGFTLETELFHPAPPRLPGQPGCALGSWHPGRCPSASLCSGCSGRHFRYGAPPVINPLGTRFPANATVRPSYNISIALSGAAQNTTFVNITTPAAGHWFIAAHLPEAAGRIEVKVRVPPRVPAALLCPLRAAAADLSALPSCRASPPRAPTYSRQICLCSDSLTCPSWSLGLPCHKPSSHLLSHCMSSE